MSKNPKLFNVGTASLESMGFTADQRIEIPVDFGKDIGFVRVARDALTNKLIAVVDKC